MLMEIVWFYMITFREPVVYHIEHYEVPYYKQEIINVIQYLNQQIA